MKRLSKRQQGTRLKWRGGLGLCLVALLPVASALAQSKPLPTDRGRVTVASIPDPYGGPKLKVLRTDSNTPLRAGTAWIWEKQRKEEPASYYVSLREKGFNAVRMILFDVWEMEAYKPSATFTPTDWNDPVYRTRQLARMERAVNYASANGMYVIINAHNKIPNYNEGYVNALWTVVAPHFANRTHVLYEASNEPMEGIGNNGSMTPNASDNASKHPRIQALRRTFNIIRKAAPLTHVMILTPSGINDYATGTGLGNLAAAFAAMPGVAVDWTKTSVAYHLYNNDVAYGAANKSANLRNLHSRYPGWPSENAFPPGDIPKAIGLDQWRSPSFPGDTYVNQTCERLGLGWSMWFINGQEQLDTNFPILWADAVAKGWTWKPDNAADEATWQPLFNGTDLSGWTVQCKPKDQGKTFWQVDAGTILCDSLGRPDHDYCWLVSDKEYGDFELRLKFQAYTHSPGNSGIQFRSRYDKDDQGGWLNGPQVDIHPPASQSWRTGLIYDETRGEQRWVSPSLPNSRIGAEHKLAGHVFKTANEGDGWNDLLLIACGNHIKTVVNGVVCTDWDGAGTLDNAAHRTKNVGSRGHFALQLHVKDQLRIRFKDIAIRELDGRDASGKVAVDSVASVKAEMPIEWPGFMRQHDMTFNTLPRNWKEAPHFGNAMVGSMLYQVDNTLKLQIFRADVQDHRDDTWGWTAYSRPRLVIGHFLLHPVGKLTGCAWHKDLWNAELTGTITTDKGEIKIRHLTHAVDMAIVTELTPSESEKGFTWTWHPAPAKSTRSGYPTNQVAIAEFAKRYAPSYASTLKAWEPNPPGRLEKEETKSIWIQDLLKGGQYATAWCEQGKDATRSLLVTIAKSYPESSAATRAKEDLNRFCAEEPKAWIQGHQAWWHAYYQQSFVTIPDKRLESLYWQMIYRYGCTSRTGRSMVDTSGLWFQGAQWPYITTDWNIQSAHWAVYTANRLEQGEEVVNRLHEGREALVQAVRPVEWKKDSAYLALAVAPDMRGARDEDMRYYNLLGNLPWTLHNAWMQYRYSMDDAMLRDKIYPLLRRSMNLYLHIVEEGKDGKLHLPPTYSPESGLWQDCAFDLALFKWGCLTLLKASKRLNIEDPLIPRWREVGTRLVDFPVSDKGFKQGSDKPLLEQHRHLSHLLMIYPLYLANIEQDGMREVLQKSMQQSLALNSSDHNAAMVQTHAVPIATALGEGEHALKGLAFHQADLLPNGLWACSGNPCIESTLSLANNIQEMLLQSWCDPAKDEPGAIRVFPALPAEWKDVEFRDLRAEGAFLVSAKRVGGQTQWVRIKSLAGEPCRIKPGFKGPVSVTGARAVILKQLSPGIYEIGLGKGEEVTLVTE